jgi:phage tail sheath protein FI
MATVYKTPGVYIEEIPKFPPSIAAVETAIPAFVGYTQKADGIKPGDLLNIPTKIGSIAEYDAYFGVGADPAITQVTLDDNKNFKTAALSNIFYMYDSLRLFYANGGGDCYIVSVGIYDTAGKIAGDFTGPSKGINALEKVDEPTILVFPDNSLLTTANQFYDVYDAALKQCGELQDRVGLFHLKEDDPKGALFRSGTGIKDLKYGAAYSPWLVVNFPKNVSYRSFKDVIAIGSTTFKLADLTSDATIQALVADYELVIADVDTVGTASKVLANPEKTLRDQFTSLEGKYLTVRNVANFTALISFLFDVARNVDVFVGAGAGMVSNASIKTSLKNLVNSTLKPIYTTLIGYDKELAAKITPANTYAPQFKTGAIPTAAEWGGIFGDPEPPSPVASAVIPGTATTNPARMDSVLPLVRPLFDQINSAWLASVQGVTQELEGKKHDALLGSFPLYKTIIAGIQNTNTTVPPSGAVAGIYAYVDRTRGVWKAPANVSISNVVGPKDTFTASELDALNIDVNSGKSINAIRSFTGKGTLVFGARTLAGNDNEWRYVSVRRFFNFVEESVKKATEAFVFEPNDANTWVRVQAMIENFLTVLWRQGALQGIKPEHAFYVAVGLGKTMTPLDILEGRMIIEIGMAAVRPAEFIILRFSHKMAES